MSGILLHRHQRQPVIAIGVAYGTKFWKPIMQRNVTRIKKVPFYDEIEK
jgi:hypothetical protein